ncbi:MAG: response regulator [Aggregatilineales bacterium]
MPTALVVEDDRDIRLLFSEALQSSGFSVITASTVAEAIALLADYTPNIAFIDMNLPEQLGTELVRYVRLQARFNAMKLVVVTANRQMQDSVEQMGVDLFLLKPVSIAEMLTLAQRLVM